MIFINSEKYLGKFYNEKQGAYIFDDNVIVTIENLTFDADVKGKDFKIGKGFKDSVLEGDSMEFENLVASNVYARSLKVKKIEAFEVIAENFEAEEAEVDLIHAENSDIKNIKEVAYFAQNETSEAKEEKLKTLDASFTGLKEDKATGIEL